jgi:hypothetical protein
MLHTLSSCSTPFPHAPHPFLMLHTLSSCSTSFPHAPHPFLMLHILPSCSTSFPHAPHPFLMLHILSSCSTPFPHAPHPFLMLHTLSSCSTPFPHAPHPFLMLHTLSSCSTPFLCHNLSDQSDDAPSDADGDREHDREGSRPRHSITKDTINTYIRIQSGMFEGLVGRIMSVTGGKCSVRVVSEGEYGGRKTSIVASNYDPVLVATEREKELIAADIAEVEQKMVLTSPLNLVSNHPLNFDFSNKYIRLKAGLYMGTIGRISKYATTSPYSVRILDMPGLKPNRHTTCTPCSIELELNCTPEELAAVESDRAQMAKLQRKSLLSHPLPPSILASLPAPSRLSAPLPAPSRLSAPLPLPSHHLLSSAAVSTSALNATQPSTSTSVTTTSTIPSSSASSSSSSSSSSSAADKKDMHVGKYVRLLGGMFRDAVGRVSSQTPKCESFSLRATVLS